MAIVEQSILTGVVQRQLVAVIDKRTTLICLSAAGQIVGEKEPFETLNGPMWDPPFHDHCRSQVQPWMAGFVREQRKAANAELLTRPVKERDARLGGFPPKPKKSLPVIRGGMGDLDDVTPEVKTWVAEMDRGALTDVSLDDVPPELRHDVIVRSVRFEVTPNGAKGINPSSWVNDNVTGERWLMKAEDSEGSLWEVMYSEAFGQTDDLIPKALWAGRGTGSEQGRSWVLLRHAQSEADDRGVPWQLLGDGKKGAPVRRGKVTVDLTPPRKHGESFGDWSDRWTEADMDADGGDLLRMVMDDFVMDDGDRHAANVLTFIDEAGDRVRYVSIDHGTAWWPQRSVRHLQGEPAWDQAFDVGDDSFAGFLQTRNAALWAEKVAEMPDSAMVDALVDYEKHRVAMGEIDWEKVRVEMHDTFDRILAGRDLTGKTDQVLASMQNWADQMDRMIDDVVASARKRVSVLPSASDMADLLSGGDDTIRRMLGERLVDALDTRTDDLIDLSVHDAVPALDRAPWLADGATSKEQVKAVDGVLFDGAQEIEMAQTPYEADLSTLLREAVDDGRVRMDGVARMASSDTKKWDEIADAYADGDGGFLVFGGAGTSGDIARLNRVVFARTEEEAVDAALRQALESTYGTAKDLTDEAILSSSLMAKKAALSSIDWELADMNSLRAQSLVRMKAIRYQLERWGMGDVNSTLQVAIKRELGIEAKLIGMTPAEIAAAEATVDAGHGAFEWLVRAVYEQTQKDLKAMGIENVVIRRGIRFPAGKVPPEFVRGSAADVDMRPASSWTSNPHWADMASYEDAWDEEVGDVVVSKGFVMQASVPASEILSLAGRGWGVVEQSEVVMLGGRQAVWIL